MEKLREIQREILPVNLTTKNSNYLNPFSVLKKGIADAKAKLKSSLDSLMDSMKIMDKTVRDIMKQAIDDGKMKYSELKALLKKLVDVATGKTTNGTGAQLVFIFQNLKRRTWKEY